MDNGKNNDSHGGSLDADIADLLGIDITAEDSGASGYLGPPDIFDSEESEEHPETADITKQSFVIPTKLQRDSLNPIFRDGDYYKKILAGKGEIAQKVHKLLGQFLNAKEPGDRSILRGRLIAAYGDLAESLAKNLSTDTACPKQMMIRYGLLLPRLISSAQLKMLALIPDDNASQEPFYYADEWLIKIAQGQIGLSATDEVKRPKSSNKSSNNTQLHNQKIKAKGQREIQIGLIRDRMNSLENSEKTIAGRLQTLREHAPRIGFPGLKGGDIRQNSVGPFRR